MNQAEWKRLQFILKLTAIGEAIFQVCGLLGVFVILLAPIWLPGCIDRFNP